MDAGDIHALMLIAIVPLSLVVALLLRDSFSIKRSLLVFVPAFLLAEILCPRCLCGPGNNPSLQLVLPPIAAGILPMFIRRKKICIPAAVLLVITALLLGGNFHSLVLNPKACQYTGDLDYIDNSCDRPAKGHELWHTWLTGLYGIEVLQPPRSKSSNE